MSNSLSLSSLSRSLTPLTLPLRHRHAPAPPHGSVSSPPTPGPPRRRRGGVLAPLDVLLLLPQLNFILELSLVRSQPWNTISSAGRFGRLHCCRTPPLLRPILPSLRWPLPHHPRRPPQQRKEIGGYRSTTRRVPSPPCLQARGHAPPRASVRAASMGLFPHQRLQTTTTTASKTRARFRGRYVQIGRAHV